MCGHKRLVSCIAFLSETRVASCSYDETMRIWDVNTGEMILTSPLSGHSDAIHCIAVHPAKRLVASASSDSTVRLWTCDSNGGVHAGPVLRDENRIDVLAIAFSPNYPYLISVTLGGAMRVWNTDTGQRVGEPVREHTQFASSVALSTDGKHIVMGFDDHTVQVWEWSSSEGMLEPCGERLTGHSSKVYAVAFSPDARVIASGSRDKTARIWDVATRTSKFTLEGHTDCVRSVVFAPSGTHVVSGSHDWTVRIWDASTGAAVQVLRGHTGPVQSVACSPDGTRIASGSCDRTVRVWDFVTGAGVPRRDEDAEARADYVHVAHTEMLQ